MDLDGATETTTHQPLLALESRRRLASMPRSQHCGDGVSESSVPTASGWVAVSSTDARTSTTGYTCATTPRQVNSPPGIVVSTG